MAQRVMPYSVSHGPPHTSFVWQDGQLLGEVSAIFGDPIEDLEATYIEYYNDDWPRAQTRQASQLSITCGDFAGSVVEYQRYLISLRTNR